MAAEDSSGVWLSPGKIISISLEGFLSTVGLVRGSPDGLKAYLEGFFSNVALFGVPPDGLKAYADPRFPNKCPFLARYSRRPPGDGVDKGFGVVANGVPTLMPVIARKFVLLVTRKIVLSPVGLFPCCFPFFRIEAAWHDCNSFHVISFFGVFPLVAPFVGVPSSAFSEGP